jgi:hypothetical protein
MRILMLTLLFGCISCAKEKPKEPVKDEPKKEKMVIINSKIHDCEDAQDVKVSHTLKNGVLANVCNISGGYCVPEITVFIPNEANYDSSLNKIPQCQSKTEFDKNQQMQGREKQSSSIKVLDSYAGDFGER